MVCSCTFAGTKACLSCPTYRNEIASLPVGLPSYPIGEANLTMQQKLDELIDEIGMLKKHIMEVSE